MGAGIDDFYPSSWPEGPHQKGVVTVCSDLEDNPIIVHYYYGRFLSKDQPLRGTEKLTSLLMVPPRATLE